MAFWSEKGRLDGLGIGVVGDMKYARAVSRFSVSMFEALFMPEF